MDGRDIARVVQRAIALPGVEGDFAGHSLRAGFVTAASQKGFENLRPNIIREALESAGVHAGGFGEGGIPFFESAVAADMLADRVEVKVVEVFGEVLP